MFQTLLASHRSARRLSPASLIAVGAHLALAAAAASATMAMPRSRSIEILDRPLPAFVPQRAAPRTAAAATTASIAAAPTLPALPDLPTLLPAAAGIPTSVPPVRVDLRALTGPSSLAGPIGGGPDGAGAALSPAALAGDQVDDPVVVISQRPPRYPPALKAAGIAGAVRLAFVVDTAGRVEPASLRVLETTAPGFDASAREALLATRFRPARARGQAVRQLAEQWVRFTVNH